MNIFLWREEVVLFSSCYLIASTVWVMTWAAVTVGWKENSVPPIASCWAGVCYDLVCLTQIELLSSNISKLIKLYSHIFRGNWEELSVHFHFHFLRNMLKVVLVRWLVAVSPWSLFSFFFCALCCMWLYAQQCQDQLAHLLTPPSSFSIWFWTKALRPSQALHTECGWCNV